MRWRSIVAVVLIMIVLYICISPFISSPKTALRAKQIAALLLYLLIALGEMYFGVVAPEAQPQRVDRLSKPSPIGDPLAESCLLRV